MYNPSKVNFGVIKINSIGGQCHFGIGQHKRTSNFTVAKKTQGFGGNNGDLFRNIYSCQFINDNDIIDKVTDFFGK